MQIFGGLVLGCIEADFFKQTCAFQYLTSFQSLPNSEGIEQATVDDAENIGSVESIEHIERVERVKRVECAECVEYIECIECAECIVCRMSKFGYRHSL